MLEKKNEIAAFDIFIIRMFQIKYEYDFKMNANIFVTKINFPNTSSSLYLYIHRKKKNK